MLHFIRYIRAQLIQARARKAIRRWAQRPATPLTPAQLFYILGKVETR